MATILNTNIRTKVLSGLGRTKIIAPAAAGAADVLTGIVARWRMDTADISGTTLTDFSGNGHDGTLVNGPTTIAGHIHEALNFTSSSNQAITVLDDTALQPNTNDWTVAFFAKFLVQDYASVLVCKRNNSSFHQWSAGIFDGTSNYTAGKKLVFTWCGDNGNCMADGTDATVVNDTNWHHIACVTNYGFGFVFYIDGISVASHAILSNGFAPLNDTSQVTMAFDNGSTYTDVGLDEVRIYNRALTPTEVGVLASQ